MRLVRRERYGLVEFGRVAAGHPDDPCGPVIVGLRRCRRVFVVVAHEAHALLSAEPVGVWRNGAHVLWEPPGPMRCRVGPSKHGPPSGVGTDY